MGRTHEPKRTCVGCRESTPKRSLLRIVRLRDGRVRPDPTGSEPGRGAYVHRETTCIDAALARGALAGALRTGLDAEGAARLRADIEREVMR